jgi:hypothetical protein
MDLGPLGECDICLRFKPRKIPCPLHATTEEQRKLGLEEVVNDAIHDGAMDVARAVVQIVYGHRDVDLELEIRDDPHDSVKKVLKDFKNKLEQWNRWRQIFND